MYHFLCSSHKFHCTEGDETDLEVMHHLHIRFLLYTAASEVRYMYHFQLLLCNFIAPREERYKPLYTTHIEILPNNVTAP